MPTPITDMASDLWFVHQLMLADASHTVDNARDAGLWSIDSKAMRKVDIGQDIVVVAEFATGVSSGFTMTVGGRMLIKVN